MHEIIFYKDASGKQPVLEYLLELSQSDSKTNRIKLNKVNDYIQALSVYGADKLTQNYVKHLEGELRELRPIRDRIIFAAVFNGAYVLLHQFVKTTPKNAKKGIR